MVHFSCSSSLCFNTYRSKDANGFPIKFHKLPKKHEDVQKDYQRIFKTTGFNWKTGYICSEHWSSGHRKDPTDLPDVPVPESQFKLLKVKCQRSMKALERAVSSGNKLRIKIQRKKYFLLYRKLKTAATLINKKYLASDIKRRSSTKRKISNATEIKNTIKVKSTMEGDFVVLDGNETKDELKAKIIKANQEISTLKKTLKEEKNKSFEWEVMYLKTFGQLVDLESHSFDYKNLKASKSFDYLCGLSVIEFNLIVECLRPYAHLLKHCCTDKQAYVKMFDTETQLLITLTICRHALDLKFMAFVLKCSETTVQRIFNSWTIFVATVFNRIDLRPGHGFLLQKMPKIFVTTGHGLTDLIIDATEFKFQCATNYEINSLMFSNYKNTQTGKALIGISAHGSGIVFSDIYPGSIPKSLKKLAF